MVCEFAARLRPRAAEPGFCFLQMIPSPKKWNNGLILIGRLGHSRLNAGLTWVHLLQVWAIYKVNTREGSCKKRLRYSAISVASVLKSLTLR